ncbi:predicted protein [Sclerotinia sclerotiorum 1980 UF-70]|uniref:Uncharacterized protein n=1 Tax=Sclerotinia sclerotiorum (strain ATCC 18683 / 1980 / Ss-1) TaxID=665079 RepID=A7F305_SCLS1|nr:predicted protein [Sclerotinia sclerotiorum 1980 UF-70]EDN96097.1 predicted protein [Sclerotinia sclerotiorum 1980 UF-70]
MVNNRTYTFGQVTVKALAASFVSISLHQQKMALNYHNIGLA